MDVLVLGIDHKLQPAHIRNMSTDGSIEAFEREQKEAFAQLLYDLIRERGIEFVGEETKHGEESIAQRLCSSERVRYANIEMPPQEREARNIPRDYADNPHMAAERDGRNREREEYMATETFREAEQANRILIICGRLHAEALACRFRAEGHQVQVDDVQQQDWYVEDWFGHLLR